MNLKDLELIKMSIDDMQKFRLRTFLTVVSIAIGVFCLVILSFASRSGRIVAIHSIKKIGTNLILVFPGEFDSFSKFNFSGLKLTMEDSNAIEKLRGVEDVLPQVGTMANLRYRNKKYHADIFGATEKYYMVREYSVKDGSFFNETDVKTSRKVCVLGNTVKEKLFGNENPINKTIEVETQNTRLFLRVIGALERKGQNLLVDQDNRIIIPITRFHRSILKSDDINLIYVKAVDGANLNSLKKGIENILRTRYKDNVDSFSVKTQDELTDLIGIINTVFSLLIAVIVSISLVVGGIGIMNIMLITVSERTTEIGIKMALGANRHDILLQFLTESVLISLLATVSGIVIGLLGSLIVTLIFGWEFSFSFLIIVLAFVLPNIIGIFSGIYPARKAANLDPVEALRRF